VTTAEHPPTAPALSVVVVTPTRFLQVRRTVAHLRAQSIVDRIELVLVAPTQDAVADADPAELAPFAGVQRVAVGPIPNVDRASASGIRAASAPVVAIVEDHGFVQPGWAAAVVSAYDQGPWTAVGSVMLNANPSSHQSWCNLLLAYGWWLHPESAGELPDVPGHNISYRRDALLVFGDGLPDRLGRAGDLHDRLRAGGARFLLAADAAVAHVNPSRWRSTAQLRFNAGRLYGWQRSRDWPAWKRWVYALGSPLIPLVRLLRLRQEQLAGSGAAGLVPGIVPTLLAILVLDALGQAAGYLDGPGGSIDLLATFEMDRRQHLRRSDGPLLAPLGADAVLDRAPDAEAA
jgi:hypothetical protein